jgi:hypothetical protein
MKWCMNMENHMDKKHRSMLAGCVVLSLTACGTPPVHKEETFNIDSPYQRSISTQLDRACDGARLALLSQGYAIDDTRPHHLIGNKAFQPDEDVHVILEFHVVCAMASKGTTLYANAVESHYELKKTSNAAGLSIPTLGSISLPWGGSTDALVKVSGETVKDAAFYRRFFDLVEQQLGITPHPKE